MPGDDRFALVIDDDPLLQRLVCSLLERRGFRVKGVGSVADAIVAIDQYTADLIVLDLNLGQEDGVDVLEHLGKRGHRAAILPVSGFDRRVLRTAVHLGRNLGLTMIEPLPKPFTATQLAQAIENIPSNLLPLRESDLAEALDADRLEVQYQPKIDLTSGEVVGVEALCRWKDADRGWVSPDRFIPLAENTALIHTLTRKVLHRAMTDCARWWEAGFTIGIAVNLSARSLTDIDLPARIEEVVRQAGLPPEALTLELTETAAMQEVDTTMKLLTRLRLRGFSLAIDDFGTGYSSLVELHRMPFSELKIDQGFVRGLDVDPDAATITRAIVGLGHALGMSVVAEGVETEAVALALRQMGCDQAQGFYFDRAIDSAALLQRLGAKAG